ncbi:helix-turn-helix domain-containing protein [Leptolyngbya subtilissima ST-M1]|uniref:helix-turn-helix domain-containing protein n=1 Tax=Cyanophyceae TaxID=3028117 RepID=UPI001F555906|nr:helix-turn-helix domain-containing protein [Nodosilinea sp. FACHB-131]
MPPDSPSVANSADGATPSPTYGWTGAADDSGALLSVDAVQKYLNRSRASVYRYANTDPDTLNPPYNKTKLNPEVRRDKDDPLEFRPQEVRRFAEEVLGLHPTIQVQPPEETLTHDLMRQVLQELRAIRQLLEERGVGGKE